MASTAIQSMEPKTAMRSVMPTHGVGSFAADLGSVHTCQRAEREDDDDRGDRVEAEPLAKCRGSEGDAEHEEQSV